MAFWLNILALVRRRGVGMTALGVSVLLAVTAFFALPNRYVCTATLILTTSPTNAAATAGDPNVPAQINPLLNFSDGLNTALAIIVQTMNTDQVLDELETGSGSVIEITDVGGADFVGNKGPFLFLTGSSTISPDAARDIVVRAEERTKAELSDRQRTLNAPSSQLISTLWVVQPTTPTASVAIRVQGAAFALVLGLILVVAGAYVREARRGTRHTRTSGEPDLVTSAPGSAGADHTLADPVQAERGVPAGANDGRATVNGVHTNGVAANGAVPNGGAMNGTFVNGTVVNGAAFKNGAVPGADTSGDAHQNARHPSPAFDPFPSRWSGRSTSPPQVLPPQHTGTQHIAPMPPSPRRRPRPRPIMAPQGEPAQGVESQTERLAPYEGRASDRPAEVGPGTARGSSVSGPDEQHLASGEEPVTTIQAIQRPSTEPQPEADGRPDVRTS